MHFHCEIIMPPTPVESVQKQVESIMAPFSETDTDSEDWSGHSFWDYWVIGGRWSGIKAQSLLDAKRIDEFRNELQRRKITVSGIQWGKQEISPASQIAEVDSLWAKWFPDSGFDSCPLFKHAGDSLIGDICDFSEVPLDMKASRVIVASTGYSEKDQFQAEDMVEDNIWNGVVHQDTTWNGSLADAVDRHTKRLKTYTDEARERYTIQPEWTVVTIDYHS